MKILVSEHFVAKQSELSNSHRPQLNVAINSCLLD